MLVGDPTPKRTILCIDDNEVILRYERVLLETSGYVVLTATSPQQGLKMVTMCECDAVLLDYEMPRMSGHEVAFQIKRIKPDLMIIMLSGSDVPTDALRWVDAFVPKLEASRQLLPMIAEICKRTQGKSQQHEDLSSRMGDERHEKRREGSAGIGAQTGGTGAQYF